MGFNWKNSGVSFKKYDYFTCEHAGVFFICKIIPTLFCCEKSVRSLGLVF